MSFFIFNEAIGHPSVLVYVESYNGVRSRPDHQLPKRSL
jgi:hypothetical protein